MHLVISMKGSINIDSHVNLFWVTMNLPETKKKKKKKDNLHVAPY